jgi:flagellar motor switch protein FliM
LQRRHVKIDLIKCIGKESNSLEAVDEGLEHSAKNVYREYTDPKRTEWIVKIQPALKKARLKFLARLCKNKLSRREIIELRAGRSLPHRRTQELFESMLKRLGFL